MTSEAKYPIDLEKKVDAFLDKHAFISKIYTMYRLLTFAYDKGVKFDKSHVTWSNVDKSRNILAVKAYTKKIEKYIEDNTIYKPHVAINNIVCQVLDKYEAEFLEYLYN